MASPHLLTNAIRQALKARLDSSGNTVRAVATASGVNYKNLLFFYQGGLPDFGMDDLERLAAYLKLRLVPEPPPPAPEMPKPPVRRNST
jgi:hypothetical protein